MKHVKYFKAMMEDAQEINLLENGITFTKEGFTGLYEQAQAAIQLNEEHIAGFIDGYFDANMDKIQAAYNKGVRNATVKGIVIGGVTTGVGMSLMKIRDKRKQTEQKLRRDNLQGED